MKRILLVSMVLLLSGCLWTSNSSSYESAHVANIQTIGEDWFPDDDVTWSVAWSGTQGGDLVLILAVPSENVGGDGPILFVAHGSVVLANATVESGQWVSLSHAE